MVAQEFAVTFPERVERLALLATSPGGAFSSYPLERPSERLDDEGAARSLQLVDRRWTPELAAHPEQMAHGRGSLRRTTSAAAGCSCRRARAMTPSRLNRISCPDAHGSGRYDDIAPVVNGQAIADRIPGATLHIYNGGHLPRAGSRRPGFSWTSAFLSAGTE